MVHVQLRVVAAATIRRIGQPEATAKKHSADKWHALQQWSRGEAVPPAPPPAHRPVAHTCRRHKKISHNQNQSKGSLTVLPSLALALLPQAKTPSANPHLQRIVVRSTQQGSGSQYTGHQDKGRSWSNRDAPGGPPDHVRSCRPDVRTLLETTRWPKSSYCASHKHEQLWQTCPGRAVATEGKAAPRLQRPVSPLCGHRTATELTIEECKQHNRCKPVDSRVSRALAPVPAHRGLAEPWLRRKLVRPWLL